MDNNKTPSKYPITLTDKQREYLKEHIDDFYRVFVTEDQGLEFSRCSCCVNRRVFMKEFHEHGQ